RSSLRQSLRAQALRERKRRGDSFVMRHAMKIQLNKILLIIALIMSMIGVVSYIGGITMFLWNEDIRITAFFNSEKASHFGSFISGTAGVFWSFTSTIFFYLSLRKENERYESEALSREKDSIQKYLNSCIEIHINIINNLSYTGVALYQGYSVVKLFKDHIGSDIFETMEPYLEPTIFLFKNTIETIDSNGKIDFKSKLNFIQTYYRLFSFNEKIVYKNIIEKNKKSYSQLIALMIKYKLDT
ncbi:hypothetical protein, partial [Leptospira yasudae]|uniref:hypothetical protein n=1 Tax=Leptospira yasudae TaxID=2202201 RepID=UPI00142D5470